VERFSERAIVLSTVDYGDADRLAVLFTEGRGKLTAFAAGARKSKRRFAGALQPGAVIRAQLVERRGTTVRMDGADIEMSFSAIRGDLSIIARALYTLELCRELLRDHEPHLELFGGLIRYLQLLDQRRAGPTSLIAFELQALALAGLMPRLDQCALCGGDFSRGVVFDPEHGGAVCEECRPRVHYGVPMSIALLRSLYGIQRGHTDPIPSESRRRAREILNLFISHQLGRKLKSVDFMAQVGLD
jgi:DNA repair protein RecO (recombination protein O)